MVNKHFSYNVCTIANRFLNPLTKVGCLLNFWAKASLRLCAGSVEIIKTDSLTLDSKVAMQHEFVVLPTPPRVNQWNYNTQNTFSTNKNPFQ